MTAINIIMTELDMYFKVVIKLEQNFNLVKLLRRQVVTCMVGGYK